MAKNIERKVDGVGCLYVRDGPSREHNKIGLLHQGMPVVVKSDKEDNGYIRIAFEDQVGWVLSKYIKPI